MTVKLTLGDVRERLELLADDMYSIPNDFIINEEFLNGISKDHFIKAFSEYRDIVTNMYREAAFKPYDYGYSSVNKNTGEEKLYDEFSSGLTYLEKIVQIHHFINKLCDSSEFLNDALVVDISTLLKLINTFPKIKNPDKLMYRLIDFGFVFEGYSGKLNTTKTLSITHNKNIHIIKVMKSFSESKYSKIGMEFDYVHFNYKLLAIGKEEDLQLTHLFVYNTLSEEAKEFLLAFNAAMNKEGYYYGEGATSGLCWGISQFAYSKAPEKKKDYICRLYQRADKLVVRLYLKNIDAYSSYIENAKECIREAFINDFGKCIYCKGDCKHRKTYRIYDNEYNKCDGLTFEFYNIETDNIPYYMDMINFSAKSKKV